MDFGRIQRETGAINLAERLDVITEHTALEHMADRDGINPFTKERITFIGKGKAFYVVEGNRRGNAGLAHGEVLTTGIPRATCEEIAARLGARVLEDDRS